MPWGHDHGQTRKRGVAALIKRAREAQATIENWSQERTDTMTKALVWSVVKPGTIEAISKLAVEESQLGNYQSKYTKLQKKLRGALRDMTGKKSVGVIEEDAEKGIIKIAKPVGVIGAPHTLHESRSDARIHVDLGHQGEERRHTRAASPHQEDQLLHRRNPARDPEKIRRSGGPHHRDGGPPSMEDSGELMKQCDLIVATGGTPLVKVAYSSGTPAYGVGAGNAVVIVDETADIAEAAHKIMLSKTFDFATSCSSENSILVVDAIYDKLMAALAAEGGYLVDAEGKKKLQNLLWEDGHLSRNVTAQPAAKLAAMAGIELPEGRSFFLVSGDGSRAGFPLLGREDVRRADRPTASRISTRPWTWSTRSPPTRGRATPAASTASTARGSSIWDSGPRSAAS